MHEVEASVAYKPASQLVHELSDVAPVVELAFPASHARHVADEVADGVELYRPTAHCVHEAEASVAYEPASQLVHVADPVVELAFPASHAKQAAEDGAEL